MAFLKSLWRPADTQLSCREMRESTVTQVVSHFEISTGEESAVGVIEG